MELRKERFFDVCLLIDSHTNTQSWLPIDNHGNAQAWISIDSHGNAKAWLPIDSHGNTHVWHPHNSCETATLSTSLITLKCPWNIHIWFTIDSREMPTPKETNISLMAYEIWTFLYLNWHVTVQVQNVKISNKNILTLLYPKSEILTLLYLKLIYLYLF